MSKSPTLKCYCGRSIEKAVRFFGGVAYCRACYDQEFNLRPCIKCGTAARLHVSQTSGLCRSCEIDDRRCLRCSNPVPRAALRLPDGVVCPGCRRYFPPYPKAQDRSEHRTCSGCLRHRKPVIWTLSRKPLCVKCIDEGNIEIARIESENYWIASAVRRWRTAAASLTCSWHQALASEFCTYLIGEIGPDKTAMQVDRQIEHLDQLAKRIPAARKPTKAELLNVYTASDIKKAELFFRFLREHGIEVPTRKEADEQNERRRVQVLVEQLAGHPLHTQAVSYHQALLAKKDTTPKSIRLAMCPAVRFSLTCEETPTDEAVSKYLQEFRGQRNALYGFITHLQRAGHSIQSPDRVKGKSEKLKSSDVERAFQAAETATSPKSLKSLIAALLTSATGIPLLTVTRLPVTALTVQGNGEVVLTMLDLKTVIRPPLASLLCRYLEARKAESQDDQWLFPGRPIWEPLSVATVAYHLGKWQLGIETLGRMARNTNKRIAAEHRKAA